MNDPKLPDSFGVMLNDEKAEEWGLKFESLGRTSVCISNNGKHRYDKNLCCIHCGRFAPDIEELKRIERNNRYRERTLLKRKK